MLRVLIVVLLFFPFSVFAGAIKFEGTAPGAHGKKLRIYKYQDYLTHTKTKIAETTIDMDASFSVDIDANETDYYVVYIHFFAFDIFLEPETDYVINVDSFTYLGFDDAVFIYDPFLLNYSIVKPENESLNSNINKFNETFEEFSQKYFNDIYMRKDNSKVDSLKQVLNEEYKEYTNVFFHKVIDYQLANLEIILRNLSRENFIKKYFSADYFSVKHPECMNLFTQYFKDFFTMRSKYFNIDEIQVLVNGQKKAKPLIDIVQKDPLLNSPEISELIMLKGVYDLYNQPNIRNSAVVEVLNDYVSGEGLYITTAQNILEKFNQFNSGNPAPDFNILIGKNDTINLRRYKGEYLCLNFWSSKCTECLSEFEYLNSIYKSFKGNLKIVSICVDPNDLKMNYYVQKKKLPWEFYHYADNYELVENYFVKKLPSYILIDDKGNVMSYNAPKPSDGFKPFFESMIRKLQKGY